MTSAECQRERIDSSRNYASNYFLESESYHLPHAIFNNKPAKTLGSHRSFKMYMYARNRKRLMVKIW